MSILTKEVIQKILNDDWLLMDDCEGLENCTVIKELARMALAALDSEPYGFTDGDRRGMIYKPEHSDRLSEPVPVYRHAQPAPAVPDDVLDALQKVARIRLDLNDFDGDRRGIADCLCDAEEALIEVVNRRAAMLAAAPQSPGSDPATVPGKWIPVSERMPDENAEQQVLACFKGGDISTLYYFEGRWDDAYGIVPIRQDVTHWMPLPAAPQEGK
ncbi:Eaa1 [Klebsiella pneumoniae]|nr:DUF551 domain-containing protein [Klebsiella pneumoniae]SWN09721.1 Eaa1 [Klebsiella pneumoniae]